MAVPNLFSSCLESSGAAQLINQSVWLQSSGVAKNLVRDFGTTVPTMSRREDASSDVEEVAPRVSFETPAP